MQAAQNSDGDPTALLPPSAPRRRLPLARSDRYGGLHVTVEEALSFRERI